ncbi:outer membrane beta-barrel protein [Nitrospinota bacterium]
MKKMEMRGSAFRALGLIIPILFAVFVSFPSVVLAQDKEAPRFRLGGLEIHPEIEVSVENDSNIFLTKSGTKDDTIYRYVPEINLKVPFGAESSLEGGFKYEIIDFDSYDGEDTENKTATAALNLERIDGIVYSRTNGTWENTSDPSSSEQQSTTGARTPRTKGEVDSKLGYGGYDDSRFLVEANLGATTERYNRDSNRRLENDRFRTGAMVEIKYSKKTSLRFEYDFEKTEYDNRTVSDQRDDNKDHAFRAGLSFSPSALISGHATFGAEVRRFDDSLSTTDTRDRDQESFSADVDLTWEARPSRTTVNVVFAAGIENATSPGQFGYNKWNVDGTLTQGLMFINDNLEASLNVSFEQNSFLRSNREDDTFKFGADIKYTAPNKRYPWFAAFNFDIKKKSTNENKSSVEYRDNIFLFKVGLVY